MRPLLQRTDCIYFWNVYVHAFKTPMLLGLFHLLHKGRPNNTHFFCFFRVFLFFFPFSAVIAKIEKKRILSKDKQQTSKFERIVKFGKKSHMWTTKPFLIHSATRSLLTSRRGRPQTGLRNVSSALDGSSEICFARLASRSMTHLHWSQRKTLEAPRFDLTKLQDEQVLDVNDSSTTKTLLPHWRALWMRRSDVVESDSDPKSS